MSGVLPAGAVALDFLLAAACAWLLVRWLAPDLPGILEPVLAWALSFGGMVVGAGVLLGETGRLGPAGFICLHGLLAAALAAARRERLPADLAALRACLSRLAGLRSRPAAVTVGLSALFLFWASTAVLSALGEPFVYDALTYHLPRIGQWLQEGRVSHYATADPRQNFMFVTPELLTAWLLQAVPSGFRFAALAQCYGAGLLLASTYGLARLTGLSPAASLGAAALLFGMANVVPQFACVYTDLFPAAVLAASFCLWMGALRRGRGSPLAGLGAGLALASKTTVLYLGPAIVAWVAGVAWRHRAGARAWAATLAPALASALFFAGPVLVANWRDYGALLGPDYMVRLHHGDAGSGTAWAKLSLNLKSSFAQVFDPNSQPPLLAALSRDVGRSLAQGLPEHDRFMEEDGNRRQELLDLFALDVPDTDQTSFGVLALIGVAAGALAAASGSRPGSGLVLAWTAGLAAFSVFFLALHQWATYGFRLYVLAAPWMAVVTAWWLEALPRLAGRLGWALWLASAACVAVLILTLSPQAGWRPIEHPDHSIGFLWRQWAAGLDGRGPLRVDLPYNRPVAAFYRLPSRRRVEPGPVPDAGVQTAEGALQGGDGWLVVPARLFQGREGDVVGETWLYQGDGGNPFSLAAYRLRGPGDSPPPIIYRRVRSTEGDQTRLEMLVGVPAGRLCQRLMLRAGGSPCRYALRLPAAREGRIAGGGAAEVALPEPAPGMIRVEASFRGLGDRDPAPADPQVAFVLVDGPTKADH